VCSPAGFRLKRLTALLTLLPSLLFTLPLVLLLPAAAAAAAAVLAVAAHSC
jgi:hypothetical protein